MKKMEKIGSEIAEEKDIKKPEALLEPQEIYLNTKIVQETFGGIVQGRVIEIEKRIFDDREKYVLKLEVKNQRDTFMLVLNRNNALFLKKNGIIYDIDILGKEISIEIGEVKFRDIAVKSLIITEVK